MLGRRQIRAKVMQSIYAYYRSGDDLRKVEKNLFHEMDEIQTLYYYLLNFIKAIHEQAEKRIEVGLNKNFPSAAEANPNRKFVNNQILKLINDNKILIDFTENHKEYSWNTESYPDKIFREFTEGDEYKAYLSHGENNFKDDKKIVLQLFENYIAPNEELHEMLEDRRLHWSDDMHIANTMVLNTLQNFRTTDTESTPLFKLVKDDEHLDFARDLFRKTISNEKELSEFIDEKASNWELDRIALVDKIILQMALCELFYFPQIPPKVSINEYVEIAKSYSTPNSKIFVNGILDRTLKELKETNKLNKRGAGLL